ncbi:hypothetical protein DFH05DRAFT_1424144 [Lentinula detonsa]|uniref:Uncharacterized protein n=1 Tax=Lentinula detonsa TaxID=2804962 RepID=A0A9W8TUH2_9AGAR|nr:hypothetical protein DFH05DRAFT_1424144 [Lentinula detonsa]
MFQALKKALHKNHISFHGEYTMPTDPFLSDRERVKLVANEIWKVTGYRFTVNNHPKMIMGHKTRYWCCQDSQRKKAPKPSQGENVVHRDYVGMERFPCKSRLTVTSKLISTLDPNEKLITIKLDHCISHVHYYDVSLKDDVLQILRDNLLWSTPSSLVPKIQELHPEATAKQIHSAWTVMSEELWKKDPKQLPSAKLLLEEYSEEVDVFEATMDDGVEMLAWGPKQVVNVTKR